MTTASPGRGRGRPDHVMRSAARGAVLIGLAIVVGIILLQVVDQGSPSPGSGTTVTLPSTATTTATGTASTATTKAGSTATTKAGSTATTKAGSTRTPANVKVYVQNGSGVNGAATTKANELKGKGYVIVGTGNAATQTNNAVACRSGFDKEAQALIVLVTKASVAAFPATLPSGADGADCIVTLGKT